MPKGVEHLAPSEEQARESVSVESLMPKGVERDIIGFLASGINQVSNL